MNCQNCGEPLEHGSLFCENCGARVSKGAAASAGNRSQWSKKKKKKQANALFILFAVLGLTAIIVLVITVVSTIRTASLKSDSQQIESDDTETALTAPGEFASAEEQTAYWQSIYRSYLEQLITERMSMGGDVPALRFTLLDMNNDGMPELVDCFANDDDSDPYFLSVYYIDGGAVRLLGEADVCLDGTPMFYAFDDKTLDTVCYIGGLDYSISTESKQDYSIWGCQSNGELYFERLFFQQSSSDRNQLLELADSDSIYYDSETGLYTISVYQGAFVTPDVLEDAMEAFANQLERHMEQVGWFQDGSEDGSYPSRYLEFISGGMSAVSAADELIDSIFKIYSETASGTGASTESSTSNSSVYWSATDEYYHLDPDCVLIFNIDSDQLFCGTVDDAIAAGHSNACPYCAGG